MKLKLSLTTLGASLLLAPTVQADTLGIFVGVSRWQSDYSGEVQDGATLISLKNDLRLDDDDSNIFRIALEHPIPLLPNIQLAHTDLKTKGNNTLTRTIEFGDSSFTVNSDVHTNADLTHTDLTLYYQILDNWVSVDLGVTARFFDGFVEIRSATESAREDLEDPIPLLYAKAQFDLPFSGLSLGANINGIGYDGDSIIDYQIKLAYETSLGLGVELGYRGIKLELDDLSDFQADMEVRGPFASLTYHF